ncbi:MAG: transposase, partial [Alphaproteobacteria bacterium]
LRRRFFDIHAATQSPIAAEALLCIATLYAIEAGIRGSTADRRLAVRQAQSAPLVAELEAWLHGQLNRLSSGSKLAEAIRYGLRHWQGLSEFLSDGRLEMDTNTVEREIRPVAVTRKAALFAGSDPRAWLADILARIADMPQQRLHELLPWNWKKQQNMAPSAA